MAEGEIFCALVCYYSVFSAINVPTVVLLMEIAVRRSPATIAPCWQICGYSTWVLGPGNYMDLSIDWSCGPGWGVQGYLGELLSGMGTYV